MPLIPIYNVTFSLSTLSTAVDSTHTSVRGRDVIQQAWYHYNITQVATYYSHCEAISLRWSEGVNASTFTEN